MIALVTQHRLVIICSQTIELLEAFWAQVSCTPLIKAEMKELKSFSFDAQWKITLSLCKLSFKYHCPIYPPHTHTHPDLFCLWFNEIYALCIKVEDSIILRHIKKPLAKRQLGKNVFEHVYLSTNHREWQFCHFSNNEEIKTVAVKGHRASTMIQDEVTEMPLFRLMIIKNIQAISCWFHDTWSRPCPVRVVSHKGLKSILNLPHRMPLLGKLPCIISPAGAPSQIGNLTRYS